ncbi:MAG: gfo/Idh/MocA family oxidoreductase [Bacteroidales bacterium]|nr:MAG: gfo/Idh/MocA family oxidoreductase [Bacteroidales bacterium]
MNSNLPLRFFDEEPRKPGQNHVLELRCDPLERVRIAFVGLGMRMVTTLKRFVHIDDVEIVALCDISHEKLISARQLLKEYYQANVALYFHEEDWRRVCERDDVDLVYISTHYDLHVPVAVYAMECGKHAAIEVPAATTIEDCWKLVNTAEITRRHCMMMENCNYGEFEMTTLNMIQHGILGEIIHGEGAYIHDLKELIFDNVGGYWNMWRLKYNEQQNGNIYPTHGLGPVCHAMNIHRGDALDYMVSMSSNQFNLTQYAQEKFGSDSVFAQRNYKNGDMNTSIIRTKKGKTILLQHDITSPRPYSRIHLLSGTKGFVQKWPKKGMALAPNGLDYLEDNNLNELLNTYEHPIRKLLNPIVNRLGKDIHEIAKNEGMDYIMDYRLIYCLRHGLPLDQDVYDAAEWSSIIELSEKSVDNFSMSVKIPDFTRGAYNEIDKITYYLKD